MSNTEWVTVIINKGEKNIAKRFFYCRDVALITGHEIQRNLKNIFFGDIRKICLFYCLLWEENHTPYYEVSLAIQLCRTNKNNPGMFGIKNISEWRVFQTSKV